MRARLELGFHHAQQAAVIGESGQRIAHRKRANLIEEPRLIEQSSNQHHNIAGRLAQLRQEEWSIEQMPRKRCRDVADHVHRGDEKQ